MCGKDYKDCRNGGRGKQKGAGEVLKYYRDSGNETVLKYGWYLNNGGVSGRVNNGLRKKDSHPGSHVSWLVLQL